MVGVGVGAYGGGWQGLWSTGLGGTGAGAGATGRPGSQNGTSPAAPNTNTSAGTASKGSSVGGAAVSTSKPLSASESSQVDQLKRRDAEVKAHERAHQTAGGQYAGAASYTYQKGPDGTNYAIGGEVPISTSTGSGTKGGDAGATVAKMRQVQAAALAPAQPSSQDLHVAAEASQAIAKAQSDQSAAATKGTEKRADGSAGKGSAGSNAGAATGKSWSRTGAATRFQAQAYGGDAAGSGSNGSTDGGVRAIGGALSRSAAAYGAASTLGSASQSNTRLAVVA